MNASEVSFPYASLVIRFVFDSDEIMLTVARKLFSLLDCPPTQTVDFNPKRLEISALFTSKFFQRQPAFKGTLLSICPCLPSCCLFQASGDAVTLVRG